MTDIPTREVWLYLAVVENLFSRGVVGWSMDQAMTSRLVVGARARALADRPQGPSVSAPVAHPDRGSRSARAHDQRRRSGERIACGMRRRGTCWDNAPMERVFASGKAERVHDEDDATREQARASIPEYLEAFDNRVRRHASLGHVAPAEYERTHNPTHR